MFVPGVRVKGEVRASGVVMVRRWPHITVPLDALH